MRPAQCGQFIDDETLLMRLLKIVVCKLSLGTQDDLVNKRYICPLFFAFFLVNNFKYNYYSILCHVYYNSCIWSMKSQKGIDKKRID